MQVIYVLAEALDDAIRFLDRITSSTPPTRSEIHQMRGNLERALGVFTLAKNLDAGNSRLDEITLLLRDPACPNKAALVNERREINAMLVKERPQRKADAETVTLKERHQRQQERAQERVQDEPDASLFAGGGIDVTDR